jgi:DNA-binding MarR family transcriptional regulator
VSEALDVVRALVGIAVYSVNHAPVDGTVTHYRLLAVLAANGPSAISDVAAQVGVAQSNATRHCDRLQRLELVARSQAPDDGRVVLVDLTASGREIVSVVMEPRREQVSAVLERMTRPQQERVIRSAKGVQSRRGHTRRPSMAQGRPGEPVVALASRTGGCGGPRCHLGALAASLVALSQVEPPRH